MTFFSCFLQANKACKALGDAILATIEDSTANTFIKGKLSGNAWTGATDVKKVSTVCSPTIKGNSRQNVGHIPN